jgi:ribosomal protein S18 acetylase RimI-like enzyme
MTVEVRAAGVGDADALAALAAATFPLACPPSADPADIAACIAENLSAERFTDYLRDPQRRVLAAHREGRIIGYAMLIRGSVPDDTDVELPKIVELSKIYMLPEYHRSGAAAALMDAGLAWASENGARLVWLGVNQTNERAKAFYAKHGFAVTGTRTFQLGASLEDDFVMVRPLSD